MLPGSTPVLFQLSDYAPLSRRLIACGIDLALLLFAFSMMSSTAAAMRVPRDVLHMADKVERQKQMKHYMGNVMVPITIGWLACIPAYHILLRRTRGGTMGYRVTRIRMVDTYGLPPVLPVLIKRFLVAFFLVPLFGLTYFGVRKHPRRQAAHDEWAGTWLVRSKAVPSGPATIAFKTKFLGTMPVTYPDLEPASPSDVTARNV